MSLVPSTLRSLRTLCAALCLLAAPVLAADLRGTVVDADGTALPGVNIAVRAGGIEKGGAVSGRDGDFVVTGLAPGAYEVAVTHIGFQAQTRRVEFGAAGASLDITLEGAVLSLEQRVVSASRTQEKALDAPASISVVESKEIETRSVLSVSEFVRDQPGVDFAKTGLVQSNVVTRGFNNIFSGALLTLTDNRIANVPSLRLNAYNFIPLRNDDIERIEVVLGPGAALYGPNSANGVMHIVTRSPLTSTGTSVDLGIGERSLRKGSLRHAGLITPDLGYKISAQYYTGEDWQGYDREEADLATTDPRGYTASGFEVLSGRDSTLSTMRDFDISRQSVEARVDYRATDDLTGILSYGYNSGDFIELTGLGAGLGRDWTYQYMQARLLYEDWFFQYYRNWSDAGETFLLRSGDDIVDKSTFQVVQVQHSAQLGPRQRFIYGADVLLTRPDTEGTITGNNENDDDIDEYGAYLQSTTQLTDQLEAVLALRYDDHNRLADAEISPRAALVFKPRESQTLRLTYNRAFSTPTTNNLYLDLVSSRDAFGLGPAFESTLGFSPAIDVRAQGTYRSGFDDGFTFRRSASGEPMYRSNFAPAIQLQLAGLGMQPGSPGYSLDGDGYIALHDPVATNVQWNIGRAATLAQLTPALQTLVPSLIAQQLVAQGVDAETAQTIGQEQAATVIAALPSIVPTQLAGLRNGLANLNPETAGFDPVADAFDVPRASSTITQTLELGYKGIIGGNVVVAADVYRSDVENFVGPLRVETPNVFLDPQVLGQQLGTAFAAELADPENAQVAQVLGALDQLSLPGVSQGNNNGTAADEMAAIFAGGAAQIPYGTVSPEQAYDPTAVLLTYRNFGDVTLYGMDLSVGWYPTDDLNLTANWSVVDDDLFAFPNFAGSGDTVNVALNAAKQKAKVGVDYRIPGLDLRLGARVRYNSGFPQDSGVYAGDVDAYTLVDLSARYALPFDERLHVLLNVDNAFDSAYQAFVGAPEVGRLTYLQLGVDF
jgi:outer membrane receptor for ferrienterochelin and colicins